jgi:formylglycine-generating enzyme
MEDWTYGLIIVVCGIAWVHIFVDYRRKLMRVMPGVEQVAARKREFSTQISEAKNNSDHIVHSIGDLQREIESLEEKRMEMQKKLNEAEMIFIPPGKFDMGSNIAGKEDENPEHKVTLKGYYIDKFEVTNMQFKDFIDVTDRRPPIHWRSRTFPDPRKGNHPVVNITWTDAEAYAEWIGKRLPTEAEWERAARGDHGNEYPWGKSCSPDFTNFATPDGSTSPVDKYVRGVSEHKVWDMCGNVGEWVQDWYDAKYYTRTPDANPMGPENGHQRIYRGGGYHCLRMDIRCAARHFTLPTSSQMYIGFRCAMDAD